MTASMTAPLALCADGMTRQAWEKNRPDGSSSSFQGASEGPFYALNIARSLYAYTLPHASGPQLLGNLWSSGYQSLDRSLAQIPFGCTNIITQATR